MGESEREGAPMALMGRCVFSSENLRESDVGEGRMAGDGKFSE